MILEVAKYAITCMVLICLATTPASADEGPAIVLHFDEGSGTIAHDSSGNGNNGIIQDASWAEGISGTSLTFDGKQGNVDIADSVSLRPQNFTLSVWIKPQIKKSSIITQLPIVTKNTHETSKLDHGFSVYYTSFGINLQTAYGGSSNSAGLGVDLPVNTWSHIVTQYDGKNYIFYTNGERRNLGGHISPMLINYSADDLWVGKANSSICNHYNNTCQISYDYFNGSIDELYLFSRILNSSEIQLLYSNQYYWTASKIGVFRNNKTWILDASGNGVYGAGDPTYTFGTVG
ncbi:MAG: LamG domain-containing protein, partial [Deltaproteobacteria bacterium]|nr:LamG domain-containing protein [Deltaproteobacteria bacterium]